MSKAQLILAIILALLIGGGIGFLVGRRFPSTTGTGEEELPKEPSDGDREYNWSTMDEGPYNDRVSYATSTDLLHWTDSGQTLAEHASVPDAIYNPSDGTIYLYFVDVTQDGEPERIGLLRSEDKGKTWLPKVFAVIEGLGQKVAVDPDPFLLPDGRIRLYYFDIATSRVSQGEEMVGKIYSAVSDDGIHFVEEDGVRLERKKGLFDPDVIKVDNTWRMYTGAGEAPNVISATSSDGLTFTEEGVALEGGSVPNVFYDGQKYILYTAGIDIAFSDDGKSFTKQSYSFASGSSDPSSGPPSVTADPGVIQIGEGEYLMFFKTKISQ